LKQSWRSESTEQLSCWEFFEFLFGFGRTGRNKMLKQECASRCWTPRRRAPIRITPNRTPSSSPSPPSLTRPPCSPDKIPPPRRTTSQFTVPVFPPHPCGRAELRCCTSHRPACRRTAFFFTARQSTPPESPFTATTHLHHIPGSIF
jgi:hypothetical protein